MSQFTLTPDEDALVLTSLRDSAARYAAMFGVADPALEAVIAKVEGQLPASVVAEVPAVVVEEAPVAEAEPVAEEKPAKAKKVKAEDEAE
jgi:hypothetical protein